MGTGVVTQEIFFNAVPHEVYEVFLDAKQHAELTGKPSEIDRRSGGRFSLFGGMITGKTITAVQGESLEQDWRNEKWPAGHFSRVRLKFRSIYDGRGTQLSLLQTDIPVELTEDVSTGWRDHYWNKLGDYLRGRKVRPVRRFLEEFKNRANIDVVDETWTRHCVLHVTGFPIEPGREGQKNIGRAIFAAFGDVHVEVNDTIVEGDRVVERHTAHAVHKGEFQGISATGRKVYWTENHIYRIVDGQIAETWSEPSFHDLLRQIREPQVAGQAGV